MADTNRIALVSGANKGIGLEIARQLAQAGVFVIIGARDPARGEAAVADLASQGLRGNSSRSTSSTTQPSRRRPRRSVRNTAGSTSLSTTPESSMLRTVHRPHHLPMRPGGSWIRTLLAPWP